MRAAHKHPPIIRDDHISDNNMKQIIYGIIVFLALVCVVSIGIIVIHWSIQTRTL